MFLQNTNLNHFTNHTLSIGRSATNRKDIAENFNNYFISISQGFQKKLPPTKEKAVSKTFFLSPATSEEVHDVGHNSKIIANALALTGHPTLSLEKLKSLYLPSPTNLSKTPYSQGYSKQHELYQNSKLNTNYCMLLSWHVCVLEWIYSLQLPGCQGTPCSEQARYLKFTWQ